MLKFVNTIQFLSKGHKPVEKKVFFSSVQMIKKDANASPLLKRTFLFTEEADISRAENKEGHVRLMEHNFFAPFTNSFLYDDNSKKHINWNIKGNHEHKKIRCCSESSFITNQYDDFSKWSVLKKTPVLSFSWLKTIRKKQYYNIIGKIGIKKRNAGMYWKFYVAKRKKIRKKRRTI